ncbi:MAG: hypothetical protein IJ937_04025, partial [Treponema sp.]|nr:hypothetical protein [Treponema sp.]
MKKESKKTNPFLTFIKTLLIIFLILILLLAGLFTFSALDKKDSLSVIPNDYSIYLHTDSIWDSLEPLLDLQAADIYLSSPSLVQFRGMFMNLRSSNLRSNKILKFIAARPVTATLYTNQNSDENEKSAQSFVAVANLGYLSAATRLFPLYKSHLPIEIISQENHYEIKLKDSSFYFKPVKNLLVISNSEDYLNQAIEKDNSLYLTAEQKSELSKKNNKSIRLLADTQKLAKSFTEGHELLSKLTTVLTENKLSEVSFEITDKAIQLQANLPFELSQNKESFESLLSKKSTMPNLLTHFPEVVQYYTTINAGSIEELKTALFPLFPAEKNPNELWKKADSMCNMFLSISLEELLFSWTGEEFSAFGIRGHNEPVFAIQIKDEDQRQLVFEKIISSFLIKNDASLILNGVRLPQLQLPGFINSLLSLFDIN